MSTEESVTETSNEDLGSIDRGIARLFGYGVARPNRRDRRRASTVISR